ncbi:MAG: beta-hydroxyacyl-ACP dehydratase [Flavobacterium psychrophilum]|uniref:3-hydroxyacyl-ACP dehydratase FabZ family protein n=1 Tax=Flavobacterium sp. AG291 TaxID=2184000 RepID=UPI000DB6C505|nr:beta-hydroxyacyl-ACP dehydratase [Flavobacterium sp. AG291]PZR18932.1 MAG: beta-hydroxyacyl-ACP dehydratase [Flavobacterium psychrophilum]RDI15793.1 3-hydroxyacyl-[acyl-carrier-protein] dehydratase [Flavobacterium sp. AG291]
MSKAIEDLIPHRAPFLFVEEILSISNEEIVGVMTFNDKDNALLKGSFPGFDFIPGTIILESMAQCGGAGVRLLGVAEGVFALAHIETAQFYKGVHYNEQIKYVIKNVRLSAKMVKQEGRAYVNDELILEAAWLSIKIDTSAM